MPSERPFISTAEELNALVFALQEQLDAASGSVGIEDALIQQTTEDYLVEGRQVDFGSEEPPTLTSVLSEDPSIKVLKIPSTTTASSVERRLAATFQDLVDKWRSQTAFSSSIIDIVTNPAYQRIIGMGPTAIPLILQDLSKQPDHWFWALKAITGEDPVPKQDQGDLVKMTSAWLAWGASHGYEI